MHCNVENIGHEAEHLKSVLNKSWSVENIEGKDGCVIMCEQRLKKLKNRLTSDNSVEKYDQIF